MKKEDFVLWFNTHVGKLSVDGEYQDLIDYDECRYDYYYLSDYSIDFTYENLYWGGSETKTKTFSFEEFIAKYNNDTLKD